MTIINESFTTNNPRRAASERSLAGRAERRLRRALRLNATTSVTSGAVLAFAPGALDELLGAGHPGWVRLVGVAVALFGLDVAWLSRRPRHDLERFTPVVIAADLAWVVLSAVTIVAGWYEGAGIAVVIAMALAVETFAFLQFTAWRQLRRTR